MSSVEFLLLIREVPGGVYRLYRAVFEFEYRFGKIALSFVKQP
jgi:hypothetical protein